MTKVFMYVSKSNFYAHIHYDDENKKEMSVKFYGPEARTRANNYIRFLFGTDCSIQLEK